MDRQAKMAEDDDEDESDSWARGKEAVRAESWIRVQ